MVRFSPQRSAEPAGEHGGDRASRELVRAFHAVTISMHTSSDLTETLQMITDGVTRLACFRVAALNLVQPDGDYEVVAVTGPDEVHDALLGSQLAGADVDRLVTGAARWGTLRWIDHLSDLDRDHVPSWTPHPDAVGAVPHDVDAWHHDDVLFAPLLDPSGTRLGMLSVDLPVGGRKPTAAHLEILELFADSAAMAIQHARLLAAIRRQERMSHYMATHDALTGLANRAALEQAAGELLVRDLQVGVLLLDLDDFKTVNDSHGHLAGDEVLVAIAKRMSGCVREHDVVARTGGDEFVVLLADDDVDSVLTALAARLHAAICAPIRAEHGHYRVGVSIGAASTSSPASLSDLLRAADADMYRVKREGRRIAAS